MINGKYFGASVEFPMGCKVRKMKGAEWTGNVVGYYCTEMNPNGVAVESSAHRGSVQIYPSHMLIRQVG